MVALPNVAPWLEALALLGTMLLILWQTWIHNNEQGYSAFLQAALQDVELERAMMQDEVLKKIYDGDPAYMGLDESQRKRWHFYNMQLIVGELVYLAHKRRWLKDPEWEGWRVYMSDLVRNGSEFRGT